MGNYKLWLWVMFMVVHVANGCLEEERSALLEVQSSMMSSNDGVLAIWAGYIKSGHSDCCSWRGVTCNTATSRRVIKLNLAEAKYLGSTDHGWIFNASLFLPFKSLQLLSLKKNYITGWSKNEGFDKLSQLTDLKVLYLDNNPLHQNVLSYLCWISSLEVLTLGRYDGYLNTQTNHAAHEKSCPGLNNLRVLSFNGYGVNDITTVISALGVGTHSGLKNLEKLYLRGNSFNSTVFSSLMELPSLRHLDLAHNEIDGKIEMSDIISLRNLEFLDLRKNNFESFVTSKGSKRMSSPLRSLRLGRCNSNSSSVLQSLQSFSSLKSLSYEYSDLTAPTITYSIRNLTTLEYLYLEGSTLNDNFLPSIGHMTSLKVLNIAFGYNYGTLPKQGWCELKNIQELTFEENYFWGELPSCLGNLTSLRWLSFSRNKLWGNIGSYPFWRGLKSLEYLDIAGNQFEVPLSFRQFSNHTKLIYLDVGYNAILSGDDDDDNTEYHPNFQLQLFSIEACTNLQKLPPFLYYQYDLRVLDIRRNQLSGVFPTWLLENNTRLAGLYARDNAFIGLLKLPSTSRIHLEVIDVSNNKLDGHIPANISSTFPNLFYLNLSQNLLEGPIPSMVGGIYLEVIDLSNNFLSGGVPSDLPITCPELLYLRLSNNKLSGQIFAKDARPRILFCLYLNGNNFEGPLPNNIFLRTLIVLDASSNRFSGEIPRWIRDSTRLVQLDLSKNHLEGSIPAEICNLMFLQVLAMSENRLSGSIPSCVSSLPLQHIHLHTNQLRGELEHVLFNISTLKTMDLAYNSFTGTIPHITGTLYNLNYILLNNNRLEGEIPTQICQLNKLSIIDLSFNKLYGPPLLCLGNLTLAKNEADIGTQLFPLTSERIWLNFIHWISSTRHYHNEYGRLSDLSLIDVETRVQFTTKRQSYTYKGNVLKYMAGIDLSSNRLTGEFPIELGNLSKIHALNLSHNHLIGRIPKRISDLLEIESLDLSYNGLNGSIPSGVLELHFLAIFSVANNNLSGPIPEFKSQFATFDRSSYEGNPFLCGNPLDECGDTKVSNNTSSNEREESDLGYMESFYIGFVVSYVAILSGIATALCFNPYWRNAWFGFVETLMLSCYYFVLDNVVTPFKNKCCANLG